MCAFRDHVNMIVLLFTNFFIFHFTIIYTIRFREFSVGMLIICTFTFFCLISGDFSFLYQPLASCVACVRRL